MRIACFARFNYCLSPFRAGDASFHRSQLQNDGYRRRRPGGSQRVPLQLHPKDRYRRHPGRRRSFQSALERELRLGYRVSGCMTTYPPCTLFKLCELEKFPSRSLFPIRKRKIPFRSLTITH